jgi:hypothetical protein
MTGIIVHDKEGNRHEILLPKDEHLLEYVRRAQMAIEKEELFDEMVEALETIDQCFETAYAEGLAEKLNGDEMFETGSLADLVNRRLLPARETAIQALATAKGDATNTEEADNGQFGVGA